MMPLGRRNTSEVLSHDYDLPDLIVGDPGAVSWAELGRSMSPDWSRRWTTSMRVNGAEVVCPVRDLTSFEVRWAEPVRRFTWRTGQRHRPGLAFMVSTGLAGWI
ncbi:hypothetical protein GCM10022419_124460 [Nonomuraea rosea]|uniref:Uncharacterized protein n=1 Tax=Nonomuraea rosea TaxID=638574 RepID=A0ABP6ZVK5_9ACTN